MCFLEQGDLADAAGFQSFMAQCVTHCFLGDYGLSCLDIIDKILPCSSGLIPHRSHDHWNSTRWDLAWRPRPREIDSYFVFLSFVNNRTYCCHQAAWRWSCSPFQPCVGLQTCPWHPWTALWSLAMVESLESDWLIASVEKCLLYR